MASHMWTTEDSDRVYWSDGAKMLLVGLIKKYPDAIRDIRGSRKDLDKEKRDAWDLIFNELLDYGMPSTTLERVKCVWSRTKAQGLDAQKKWKRNKKASQMTKLQKSVIDLLDFMNKESQHLMPLPINIKTEPMDEDEAPMDVQEQTPEAKRSLRARKSTSAGPKNITRNDKGNDQKCKENATAPKHTNKMSPLKTANISNTDPVIKGNLNPVVLLNRIPTRNQFGGQMVNEESANYWNLVIEHEKERMTFERELHRKNVELLELKLRIEKEKLEAMLPRLFE